MQRFLFLATIHTHAGEYSFDGKHVELRMLESRRCVINRFLILNTIHTQSARQTEKSQDIVRDANHED